MTNSFYDASNEIRTSGGQIDKDWYEINARNERRGSWEVGKGVQKKKEGLVRDKLLTSELVLVV